MHAELKDWGARLSALPGFEPPAGGWAAVRAARERREGNIAARWPSAVAAALAAVAAGLGWWLWSTAADRAAAGSSLASAPGDEWRYENARLERLLAQLPEPRALRGSTAYTLAELEDRLALVDDRLSRVALEPNAPERAERLWRERVLLMNSLVQVRYADAATDF